MKAERPALRTGLQARQHYFYQLAGRLLRVHNAWVLRLPVNARVEAMWAHYDIPASTG